jgi:hypothetical protein
MTDRELLELAAKAAGIVDYRVKEGGLGALEVFCGPGLWPTPSSEWVTWNPLTDDGDALRLAVKLNIEVIPRKVWIWATHVSHHNVIKEAPGSDPYTATRRAIVRAAAALGEKQDA